MPGQDFAAKQILVGSSVLARGPSIPQPADHAALRIAGRSSRSADLTAAGEIAAATLRSPLRMRTIAPRIATDASTTRRVNGSEASSQPKKTATTGFA